MKTTPFSSGGTFPIAPISTVFAIFGPQRLLAVRRQKISTGVKKAFIHTHGDNVDDDGHILGFSKKMNSEGDDGYKHFDSFHKKNNNKYGFEIFSKFGRKETANIDTTDGDQENKEEDSGK
ncbi:uncharacterized protein isoform X2 [Leptinotarsa decemlineata]|uniref:uncharacterized protein isoform X2 n=1 Tax=Leptinotarsa decemlineata TaxID=7539 RepID=UPI003D308703